MTNPIRVLVLVCLFIARVAAQEHQHTAPTSRAWTFATDANVFVGFNYQDRKYFDFAAWESQNWLMGTAARPIGRGHLTLHGMLSLEPLTIGHHVYRVDDGSHV